jgi:hypothetical protein
MTGFNSKQAMAADKLQEPVSEALKRLAEKLRRAGASIPAPQVTGTIEGSVVSGLCVALAIVEGEIEALAQPAQEPESLRDAVFTVLEGFTLPHDVRKMLEAAYYTAPPKREWVGLTDDAIADLWYKESLDWMEFARAHEAALKEKNT